MMDNYEEQRERLFEALIDAEPASDFRNWRVASYLEAIYNFHCTEDLLLVRCRTKRKYEKGELIMMLTVDRSDFEKLTPIKIAVKLEATARETVALALDDTIERPEDYLEIEDPLKSLEDL